MGLGDNVQTVTEDWKRHRNFIQKNTKYILKVRMSQLNRLLHTAKFKKNTCIIFRHNSFTHPLRLQALPVLAGRLTEVLGAVATEVTQ